MSILAGIFKKQLQLELDIGDSGEPPQDYLAIRVYNQNFIDTTSSEWKQFKIEAVAPEGAEVARLSFRVYKGNDAAEGVVYIDDFFFADKETLSVTDIKDFNNNVKFNTLVDDVLTFSLPNKATVNIYSLDGKLLSSSRVSSGESINISHLAKGNYIVTVQDNYNKISRKIIKK
ncbi:T9SS type A sorting domain-containing protein [Riemerella anatipestifer]|uniref:T9SS type A sorting domain-containing protein n=1 Tax=Riemerella anatipestifer TaxID=34085 RepID=UPI0021D5FF95|nr:T9SS type A sorting domain-containing protein [Riemerella anatipestifer]MCU7541527.1 T9SS type A sorting domain-containing protein [Riemerella anatipestifer]MCW0512781.1 T9SS type A sorting domain-containing protein [Riemerella anatipestifer]